MSNSENRESRRPRDDSSESFTTLPNSIVLSKHGLRNSALKDHQSQEYISNDKTPPPKGQQIYYENLKSFVEESFIHLKNDKDLTPQERPYIKQNMPFKSKVNI